MCVLLEPPTMKAAIARYHVWPIALGGECSDLLAAKGEELNMKLQDTLPKFSSSPLNSYLPNRKGSSSNHHVFRGELLKFGGVSRWNRHLKHSVMLMMLVKWMFVVVDFVCQFLYPQNNDCRFSDICIQSLVLNMWDVVYPFSCNSTVFTCFASIHLFSKDLSVCINIAIMTPRSWTMEALGSGGIFFWKSICSNMFLPSLGDLFGDGEVTLLKSLLVTSNWGITWFSGF